MFSYYGSKSKIVDYYPPPKHDKIIEPFAGSARYSLKWFDRDVLLVDKYEVIVKVWHYLQQASERDILGLPKIKKGERVSDYKVSESEALLLGFLVQGGQGKPKDKTGTLDGINVAKDLRRIARNLFKIRHWRIILGEYNQIENQQATWFIDPPYQFGGEFQYKHGNKDLDFSALSIWCKSRDGQVIVCENTKAKWMDFKPVTNMRGTIHTTTEAIWTNYRTHYNAEQLQLFQETL